jgi:hypothetical protein
MRDLGPSGGPRPGGRPHATPQRLPGAGARDRTVPGKGLDHLLGYLFGAWVRCDVEVHDAPTIVGENEEAVQDSECGRRHGEKVAGSSHGEVIPEECHPVGETGRLRPMYLATVASATSWPSRASSD